MYRVLNSTKCIESNHHSKYPGQNTVHTSVYAAHPLIVPYSTHICISLLQLHVHVLYISRLYIKCPTCSCYLILSGSHTRKQIMLSWIMTLWIEIFSLLASVIWMDKWVTLPYLLLCHWSKLCFSLLLQVSVYTCTCTYMHNYIVYYTIRITEKTNSFFCLQIRRGHGDTSRGWAAKVIGTFDSIRDSKPEPFRILLHNDITDFSYSKLYINH